MTEIIYCLLALGLGYVSFYVGVGKGAQLGYQFGVRDVTAMINAELKKAQDELTK